MNTYVQSGDVTSHGNDVVAISDKLAEGVRNGRNLGVTELGLATAEAFGAFRDAWLAHGEKLGLDLNDNGANMIKADKEHQANEDYITRGYEATWPAK
ncbi:MAG TPA: hypothetical protein H9902_00920 [Candidatus Stackebrandtia faecavium]|nr:hypothetical protein [Candidatus Stackebrandtia faecavium]